MIQTSQDSDTLAIPPDLFIATFVLHRYTFKFASFDIFESIPFNFLLESLPIHSQQVGISSLARTAASMKGHEQQHGGNVMWNSIEAILAAWWVLKRRLACRIHIIYYDL